MKFNCYAVICFFMACLDGTSFATTTAREFMEKIKTVSKTEEYVSILRQIGVPDTLINQYYRYHAINGNPLFSKALFVRSDCFKSQTVSDTNTEYVSQVVFQTGSSRLDKRVYFILVNSVINDSLRNHFVKAFETTLCDLVPKGGMTFRFLENPNSATNSVLFTIVNVESCGDQIVAESRCDTLSFYRFHPNYKIGKSLNSTRMDRFELLEEMENHFETIK